MRISVINSGFPSRPVFTMEKFKEAVATTTIRVGGNILDDMSLSSEVTQKIARVAWGDPPELGLDLDCIQKVMGMIFKFESPSLNPLQKQIGGGPARGLGQYEILPNLADPADEASGRAETAYTRARNFYRGNLAGKEGSRSTAELANVAKWTDADHWTNKLQATGTYDIVEAGLTANEQYEMAVLDHLMGVNQLTSAGTVKPSFTKTIRKCSDGTLTSEMVRIYHRDYHKVTDAHSKDEVKRWNEQNEAGFVLVSQTVLSPRDIGVTQSDNTYTITLRRIPYKLPVIWGWDKNYKGRGELEGRWVSVIPESHVIPASSSGVWDSYTIDGKVITITGNLAEYGITSGHDTIFKVSYTYLDNYDPNFVRYIV